MVAVAWRMQPWLARPSVPKRLRAFQELGDAANGLAQVVFMRQKHNAEMVWRRAS
jgi:hypothetical protein